MAGRTVLTALAVVGLLVTGCASTPVERQEATVQSLVELRDTMAATQRQIEQSLASLITLINAPAPQVQEAYSRYAGAVDAMTAQAADIAAEAARLRQRRNAWLAGWDESHAQVEDPQLRALTEERRKQVLSRFETIEGSLVAARDALMPFVESLQDIQQVVGHDLSPLGINAVSRTEAVRSATENGRDASRALRVSTNDLQALIQALAPARAA